MTNPINPSIIAKPADRNEADNRRTYVAPAAVLLRVSSTAGGAHYTSDSTVHLDNSDAAGYNKYAS